MQGILAMTINPVVSMKVEEITFIYGRFISGGKKPLCDFPRR